MVMVGMITAGGGRRHLPRFCFDFSLWWSSLLFLLLLFAQEPISRDGLEWRSFNKASMTSVTIEESLLCHLHSPKWEKSTFHFPDEILALLYFHELYFLDGVGNHFGEWVVDAGTVILNGKIERYPTPCFDYDDNIPDVDALRWLAPRD